MIVLISKDLFFASKVTGTAQALGLQAVSCLSVDRLRELIAGTPDTPAVRSVILDLSSDIAPSDVASAIPADRAIPRIAFGPHVDTARLDAARDAGFDDVMPRSRFSASLPQLLRELDGGAGPL